MLHTWCQARSKRPNQFDYQSDNHKIAARTHRCKQSTKLDIKQTPTDSFTMLISSTSLQLRILVDQLHPPLLVPTIRSRSLQHCSQCNFRSMQDLSHTGRLSSTGRVSGHFVRSFHQANKEAILSNKRQIRSLQGQKYGEPTWVFVNIGTPYISI